MSFLQKLKDLFAPEAKAGQPLWDTQLPTIPREMKFFAESFRIGILCQYTTDAEHDAISKYKKELDLLGYETEALMYVHDKEIPRTVFLPTFSLVDITKQGIPYNPRIDRFMKKKFDMMFNLFFEPNTHLSYVASGCAAKCRYGAYRHNMKPCSDVFVYTETTDDLQLLISSIDNILKKQAYERKLL